MLKGIPSILSPDALKILMEMGHGDTLVISDGNFPAARCAKRLIRLDGHNVPDVLKAVLTLLPLDTYSVTPATLMKVVEGDPTVPTIWNTYFDIINDNFINFTSFEFIDRFSFYEKAKDAYAIISTSEKELYANILLVKGVL